MLANYVEKCAELLRAPIDFVSYIWNNLIQFLANWANIDFAQMDQIVKITIIVSIIFSLISGRFSLNRLCGKLNTYIEQTFKKIKSLFKKPKLTYTESFIPRNKK